MSETGKYLPSVFNSYTKEQQKFLNATSFKKTILWFNSLSERKSWAQIFRSQDPTFFAL